MKRAACIILGILLSICFSDIIHLKNGVQIQGEILSVRSDSVTIKTSSGSVSIAASEIERIETITPQLPVPAPVPAPVQEGGIPKSIKQVGYGCLGGAIGGACSGIGAAWTQGYGSGEAATTIILGSVILGIFIGAAVGGAK